MTDTEFAGHEILDHEVKDEQVRCHCGCGYLGPWRATEREADTDDAWHVAQTPR